MKFKDQLGNPVSASSQDAVAALDHAIGGYAHFSRDVGERLKAVFAADPDMPMAHILRGYFFRLMGAARPADRASAALPDIRRLAAEASMREHGHAAALDAWCRDDLPEAVRLWDAILVDHPRDFVALKLAQYGHFYLGESGNVRDAVGRCLYAWSDDDPLRPSVDGMLAFGLEEAGNYRQAERTGRRAVERDPDDPWAVHAVAHVFEMEDRAAEGIAWIRGLEAHWNAANNFRYHLWWHRALMHLDLGETGEALRLYDEDLFDAESEEYLDLCNDAALLARLEIHGIDVGDRWRAVAEKSRNRIDERLMAFADAHFALALASAEPDRAADLLASQRSGKADGWTETVTRDVGIPLCRALIAWRSDDPGMAVDLLMPVRSRIRLLGGSHAQRDLFAMILIDAAMRDGRWQVAASLLSERALVTPGDAWTLRCQAEVLEKIGESGKATEARARLASLA
ncbi:MAG: tetratricopeptide repeat protein [Rhodospirillales bacterium]